MLSTAMLIERFRDGGLKITPQRLGVFKALEGNRMHPTADDIYCLIVSDFPTVSLATIYRTLETLVKMGEIAELQLVKGMRNYDPDTSYHHHAVCTECGKIRDVFMSCPATLELPDDMRERFTVEDCRVTFYGKCAECKDRPH